MHRNHICHNLDIKSSEAECDTARKQENPDKFGHYARHCVARESSCTPCGSPPPYTHILFYIISLTVSRQPKGPQRLLSFRELACCKSASQTPAPACTCLPAEGTLAFCGPKRLIMGWRSRSLTAEALTQSGAAGTATTTDPSHLTETRLTKN